MDRLTKLERKVDAIAKWFTPGRYDAICVTKDLAAIDAEAEAPPPTESTPSPAPPRTGAQAYEDGRVSVWNEIQAILVGSGTDVTRSVPERIQALVDEVTQRRESESKLRAERAAESRRAMAAEGERDDARSIRSRMEQHLPDDTLGLDVWDAVAKVVKDRDVARAKIARLEARDREGRDLVSRYRGLQLPGSDGANRCDSYLSGKVQPDPLLVEAREVLRRFVSVWAQMPWGGRVEFDALLTKLDARIGGG